MAKKAEKKWKADMIERRKFEVPESSSQRDRSWAGVEMEKKRAEVSWDPPKVMMVSQLSM
jgi:cellulase/cellobiase CelA1